MLISGVIVKPVFKLMIDLTSGAKYFILSDEANGHFNIATSFADNLMPWLLGLIPVFVAHLAESRLADLRAAEDDARVEDAGVVLTENILLTPAEAAAPKLLEGGFLHRDYAPVISDFLDLPGGDYGLINHLAGDPDCVLESHPSGYSKSATLQPGLYEDVGYEGDDWFEPPTSTSNSFSYKYLRQEGMEKSFSETNYPSAIASGGVEELERLFGDGAEFAKLHPSLKKRLVQGGNPIVYLTPLRHHQGQKTLLTQLGRSTVGKLNLHYSTNRKRISYMYNVGVRFLDQVRSDFFIYFGKELGLVDKGKAQRTHILPVPAWEMSSFYGVSTSGIFLLLVEGYAVCLVCYLGATDEEKAIHKNSRTSEAPSWMKHFLNLATAVHHHRNCHVPFGDHSTQCPVDGCPLFGRGHPELHPPAVSFELCGNKGHIYCLQLKPPTGIEPHNCKQTYSYCGTPANYCARMDCVAAGDSSTKLIPILGESIVGLRGVPEMGKTAGEEFFGLLLGKPVIFNSPNKSPGASQDVDGRLSLAYNYLITLHNDSLEKLLGLVSLLQFLVALQHSQENSFVSPDLLLGVTRCPFFEWLFVQCNLLIFRFGRSQMKSRIVTPAGVPVMSSEMFSRFPRGTTPGYLGNLYCKAFGVYSFCHFDFEKKD